MAEPGPEGRVAELEREVRELQAELERLREERQRAAKVVKGAGGLGARILAGPSLWSTSRAWFEKLSKTESPRELASPQTADLVTALVQRVVRVGIVGLLLAALPAIFLLIQTFLLREQNAALQNQIEQQASDTLIVRRAQLLATIYDEECEDEPDEAPATVETAEGETSQNVPASAPEPEKAPSEVEPVETADAGDPERASPTCSPKAHPRARQEAVLAFCEIERGRGVSPDFRSANLAKLDLRGADLRGADFRGADLGDADLAKADLRGADLSLLYLRGAYLWGADLREARIDWADLHEAVLIKANLSQTRNLTQDQIDSARGSAQTQLPEGLKRPDHWMSATASADKGTP